MQSADDFEERVRARLCSQILIDATRLPYLCARWKREAFRHHPNDCGPRGDESGASRTPDNVRIAAVIALPHVIPDDRGVRRPECVGVGECEIASEERPHAEDGKEIR